MVLEKKVTAYIRASTYGSREMETGPGTGF